MNNQEQRKEVYKKNPIQPEAARIRRHEVTIELRKIKKEEQLLKRRNIQMTAPEQMEGIETSSTTDTPSEATSEAPSEEASEEASHTPEMTVPQIVAAVYSQNYDEQFMGIQAARKMISVDGHSPDALIAHGIVPPCVAFLQSTSNAMLQFEAAWALTNIASGCTEHTQLLIDSHAVAPLIQLLHSPTTNVAAQAAWALGNIAGDGPAARDVLINHNVVDMILQMPIDNLAPSVLHNIVWLMSNLCRSKRSAPPFEKVGPMLPILTKMLSCQDVFILSDACWAIYYITDSDRMRIQTVLDLGAVPHLVRLLGTEDISIVVPALRSVGNIITGTNAQTDEVIQAGALPQLEGLLRHQKGIIVKETAWIISNVVAGTKEQLDAVLQTRIFSELARVMKNGDMRSKKEAAWAVTNASMAGNPQQLVLLIDKFKVLQNFLRLLDSSDPSTIMVVQTGLGHLLAMSEQLNTLTPLDLMVEQMGGLDLLEALQRHENEEIYHKSYDLIDIYFGDEPGPNDNSMEPLPANPHFDF